MTEKIDYGHLCTAIDKFMAPDGSTYFEVVAEEMQLGRSPVDILKAGTDEGYDFVMQRVGTTKESATGQKEMVYVMVRGDKFNSFINRVDELAGGVLLHKKQVEGTVSPGSIEIEELPVAELSCPMGKRSFGNSLKTRLSNLLRRRAT